MVPSPDRRVSDTNVCIGNYRKNPARTAGEPRTPGSGILETDQRDLYATGNLARTCPADWSLGLARFAQTCYNSRITESIECKAVSAKKLMLSPTRISAFLECPLKYKFLYVDRIGKFYYRPKPGNAFGGTLHRVLRALHQPGAKAVSVEQLIENYRRAWVSAGYANRDREQEFLAAGEQILRGYHSVRPAEGVKTLLTEKMVKWDMGEFILAGRLDRLDQHPDGALEIIDYKSGRIAATEEDVRSDLAMSIYQLIVGRLNPESRVFGSIYCLAGGMKASAELSEEELAEVDEAAHGVASAIMGAEEYQPHRWEGCQECDFYRLCARQLWLRSEE